MCVEAMMQYNQYMQTYYSRMRIYRKSDVMLSEGDYTSDFVCIRKDGEWMVRECVFRKFLTKPMTVRLLDTSREYWLRHGISDWGIVIDEERKSTEKSVIAT